jgi:transposase
MQVLTDAQWAKFEAAIAAAEILGARPRKEDRRTIEAIVWRLDNGARQWR